MMMMMSIKNKFLKDYDTNARLIIFGWIWIIISIILVVVSSIALRKSYGDDEPYYVSFIVFGLANFIASMFLIFVVYHKEYHHLLLPWIITNYIGSVMCIIISILMLLSTGCRFFFERNNPFVRVRPEYLVLSIIGVIVAVFEIYCCSYVRKFYKTLLPITNYDADETTMNLNQKCDEKPLKIDLGNKI